MKTFSLKFWASCELATGFRRVFANDLQIMIMQLLVISAMCDYKSFSHALASYNDDINLMAEGWTN